MFPSLARRGIFVPSKVTMAAALSTQAEAAISAALSRAKWNDVKDEVLEIRNLMREGTTNHSVGLPCPSLQQDVNDKLRGLHALVQNQQRNEAFAQVHALKSMVKNELYHHRQQQMMSFSTVAERQVDDFEDKVHALHWADVEGEVDTIKHILHESSTNHAVSAPDVELQKFIENTLDDIKVMLENNPTQRGLVFSKIHALKGFVKQRLYNGLTTKDHVRAFEKEMEALRWSDIKNEMEELHQLMREGTTNHAVALPSPELEKAVDDGLREIDAMIQSQPTPEVHDQVFERIRKLKGMVKAEIYK
ncbi:hypothetical protein IV203_006165 [Nitzschia inconspicua]|uniref:Uncharacterized protein n=1 Tax=Nitzschia inconspicua TaxID=303405 RepID=A0A9K3PHM3_9STRA|nr:hypothetical protein IV203_030479 [Nitzschia inconspicua]KAG7347096.1 hypothetical protein IV203_006165 [Nitzschia inconspicua]